MRRTASILFAAAMVAGCGGVGGPGFTIPPINIPSIPPINIPSGGLPIPTGLPGTSACTLVTSAEIAAIFSATNVTDLSSGGECSFVGSFGTMAVTTELGTDLNSSKSVFGNTARDVTVAGLPAVAGLVIFINTPAVHVQRGGDQLQVLGIAMPGDDASIAKLVQVATIAVGRWP